MTDAVHAPVTRRSRREINTADMEIGQRAPIILKADEEIDRENIIQPVDSPLTDDYTQALAMAEEPVTIFINKSAEKFAPLTVDCWVNGKGAEVMANGKWTEFGWLPVSKAVTTKRKYVEVLARSKTDTITTEHGTTNDENPENKVLTSSSMKAQFSVLHDPNPMGHVWLQRLMAER